MMGYVLIVDLEAIADVAGYCWRGDRCNWCCMCNWVVLRAQVGGVVVGLEMLVVRDVGCVVMS